MPPEPSPTAAHPAERPIGQVRGTRDWLPDDFAGLAELESLLLDRFARAGYRPMRTPILEPTELHERKSGAGIVSKLYGVSNGDATRLCLRPELTASIVRAFTAADECPPLPWRVSLSGSVFRYESPRPGFDREFQQVGVELLGASGPAIDGEVIWLAYWSLQEAGIKEPILRIGHVGLILEMLQRSGLPAALRSALVDRLSEAATEEGNVLALEAALDQLADWLGKDSTVEPPPIENQPEEDRVARLFNELVPEVMGRRSAREILSRLRRKWDLGHTMYGVLERLRDRVHELSALEGPAELVLDRLGQGFEGLAPDSVASLRELVQVLQHYGIPSQQIQLDIGLGRGIGFYSQMVFELIVPTPDGPVEVCGGGRYDGLARVLGSDRDDRGVGFAFGLERLLEVRRARGDEKTQKNSRKDFLIVPVSERALPYATRMATHLREMGVRAVLELARQPEEAKANAGQAGFARVLLVGEPPPRPRPKTVGDLFIPGRIVGPLRIYEVSTRTELETDPLSLDGLIREEGKLRR